ncbi:MAG: invasion associated locus B family protein [Paracoccus sp. (in: a-proteobacteria)]|nr:invasion associated locus B family protein [Paracoccus sp. (in: a-proteobacteria)]
MIESSLSTIAQAAAFSLALASTAIAQTPAAEGEPTDDAAPEALSAIIPTLPGGARSISDVYGSWTLDCASDAGGARCAVTQTQFNPQTQQRVLSAEVTPAEGSTGAEGLVLLPFGLDLPAGAELTLGSRVETLEFSTCLPAGCLVVFPLSSDELGAGRTASLSAKIHDSEEELSFSLPLDGLAPALERRAQVLAQ